MTELEAYEWWKTEQDEAGYKHSEIAMLAWLAGCKWQREKIAEMVEPLAEHLYGHSREKAIEWAKEDKFDSCYRHAEEIINLLSINHYQSVSN